MDEEPLSDGKREEMFEEASSFISQMYPKALRTFYSKCTSEGFTDTQSMSLVTEYFKMILTQAAIDADTSQLEKELNDDSDSDSDSDSSYPWKE